MPWKVEVIADNSGKWCGNAMKYDSEDEAKAAALDLAGRWMAVREWRVVEVETDWSEIEAELGAAIEVLGGVE